MGRIGPRFTRSEPRERVREYVAGLVSGLERKNSWWIAEHAGERGPDGTQRLLRKARFVIDAIRDHLAEFVAERLGADDGVLILDETGFVKKGQASVGVARQYSGTAGRIENSQIAVFAAYASSKGHALVDRELYLPKDWTEDPARCEIAGVPAERIEAGTVTKPRLAQAMIERAQTLGLPFRWVTAGPRQGIPLTVPELRRLVYALLLAPQRDSGRTLAWSRWRRRKQHQARQSHYRKRIRTPQ
jgi:SRSO17 transposase